jgi:hypothetical protein
MEDNDKLTISPCCRLEYMHWWGVVLTYMERSPDPYYSDSETDVDIDRAMAMKIIEWLTAKYNLPTKGGENAKET